MRIVFLALTALAVSGCGRSPMATYSRTGEPSGLTAQQKQTIRLNSCVTGSERCQHGG